MYNNRRQQQPVDDDPEAEKHRKLFIGGLSYETTEDGLREHFGQWGEIVDCVVMRDPQSKRSRGFGFITYKAAEQLDASQQHRPHKVNGREVETKRAMPREYNEPQSSTNKMFVGGLKDDTVDDQIREAFQEYGEIEKIDLIRDKTTEKVKGFGFVTFKDTDSVDKCVLKKNFSVNGKFAEVKKAVAKDQQRGGGDSGRGGRGGGRGGRGGGGGRGFNDWNQGGYNQGGYNQGYSNNYGNQGGGGYGNSYGNQGGGWNQGSGGGGYDSYGGGYNNQGGNNFGGNFGQNYGDNYGGGAMKSNYSNRGQGPYGGYNNSGGYNRR